MKKKSASLIPKGEELIKNQFNVMMMGKHGTGKTQSVLDLCRSMSLSLCTFSCSTLDPFTDLVGIPVPSEQSSLSNGSQTRRTLEMIRPVKIDDADIIFFDEFNRSRSEVRDAVLEIINNRTINGDPLPKLKGCWAAMNPPGEDYDVEELDPALVDRFDVFIHMEARPSIPYMAENGVEWSTASAVVNWWNDHNKSKRDQYISPRRLMKIARVFDATKDRKTVIATLPPGGEYDSNKLWNLLHSSINSKDIYDQIARENSLDDQAESFTSPPTNIDIMTLKMVSESRLDELAKYFEDNPFAIHDHKKLLRALSIGVGSDILIKRYSTVLNSINLNLLEGFFNQMSASKMSQIRSDFTNLMKDKSARERVSKLVKLHKVIDGTAQRSNAKLPALPTYP